MARVTRDIIEQVRAAADIVDVVGRHLSLRKRGKSYVGLCPFHSEKTPSFTVSADRQAFYCFGCGAGGSVFDFLMRMRNLSFGEAVQELAGRVGVALPEKEETPRQRKSREFARLLVQANEVAADYFHGTLLQAAAAEGAREYLRRRAIPEEVVHEFRLGYAPNHPGGLKERLLREGLPLKIAVQAGLLAQKPRGEAYERFRNRLMFPILDMSGQVVGFGGRALDNREPKYLNSPETPIFQKGRVLYGHTFAREACRQHAEILVVEGYFDLLALYSHGIRQVVAPLGTALTSQHVRLLARLAPRAVLVFDGDAAGLRAAFRSLELFLRENLPVRFLSLPDEMDPDDFLQHRGKEELLQLLARARPLLEVFLEETLGGHDGSVEARVKVVKSAAPMLRLLESAMSREHYVRLLSQGLGTSEQALREELGLDRAGGAPAASRTRQDGGRFASWEEKVLRMLVHYPGLIPALKDNEGLEAFEGKTWRNLGRLLVKHYHATGLDLGSLLVELQDQETRRLVSAWSVEESPWTEADARLRLPEYLEGIKARKRSRLKDLQRLQQEIQAAEQSRNESLLAELLAKKAALLAEKDKGKANLSKGEMY